jgi:DNA-binding MarR family transcriptional regulator
MALEDRDYRRLLEFRVGIRRFVRWSEEQATAAGIAPSQHQLLLAIRGHRGDEGPSIRDVADALLLRHNSAVELVDRAVEAGLVKREFDRADQRIVRLRLSRHGARALEDLTARHLEELERFLPGIGRLWHGIDGPRGAAAGVNKAGRHP